MNQQKNNMALASMVIGIISLVASCCSCGGVIFGSLAVILACLSRVEPHFAGRAKVGLATGIIGMILGVIMGIVWIFIMADWFMYY